MLRKQQKQKSLIFSVKQNYTKPTVLSNTQPAPSIGPWIKHFPLMVLVITFLVYFGCISAGFVYDDHSLIEANETIRSLENISNIFHWDLWQGTPTFDEDGSGYYRPLMIMSLMLDFSLFELEPWGYHLHSLLWHLLSITVLGILLYKWSGDHLATACAMAVFAWHPIQVEAVLFIAARNDIMATTLLLTTLLFLNKRCPSPIQCLGAAISLLGATLCKESVLLAPLIYLAIRRFIHRDFGSWQAHSSLLCGLAIYCAMRFSTDIPFGQEALGQASILSLIKAISMYALHLFYPLDLVPGGSLTAANVVSYSFLGLLLISLVTSIGLMPNKSKRNQIILGWTFAILSFLPAAKGILHTTQIPDRYMYLPMVGVSIIVYCLCSLSNKALVKKMLLVALLSILGTITRLHIPLWNNDITLFTASVERWNTQMTQGMLAKELERSMDLEGAAHYYRLAVEKPAYEHSCFNITNNRMNQFYISYFNRVPDSYGYIQKTIEEGETALKNGCSHTAELLSPLALAYAINGDWNKADYLAKNIKIDRRGMNKYILVASEATQKKTTFLQSLLHKNPSLDAYTFVINVENRILLPAQEHAAAQWLKEQVNIK